MWSTLILLLFFFNDTATTEIYTLSLHDALPICGPGSRRGRRRPSRRRATSRCARSSAGRGSRCTGPPSARRVRRSTTSRRSEEHTAELQSRQYLVCRLLLEKKKKPTCHIAFSTV